MAQPAKMSVVKPDDLCLNPGTDVLEGELNFRSCPLTCTGTHTHTHVLTYVHMHIK